MFNHWYNKAVVKKVKKSPYGGGEPSRGSTRFQKNGKLIVKEAKMTEVDESDDKCELGIYFIPQPQLAFCLFNTQMTKNPAVPPHKGMLPRVPSLLIWNYLKLVEIGRTSITAKEMLLV
jgi:hypothetical protein